MNWLQKTCQNWSVTEVLNKALTNQLALNGPNGALAIIMNTAGAEACDEVSAFGAVSSEANAIASTIMRALGCNGYPEAPGAQPQQQMFNQPFPEMGEQDKPMDMPSAEIV